MQRIPLKPWTVAAGLLVLFACDRAADRLVGPAENVFEAVKRLVALSPNDVRTIYGPRLFVRVKHDGDDKKGLLQGDGGNQGDFTVETFTLEGYAQAATIRIANGDASGRSRVTTAWVLVDDKPVVRPDDFSQKVSALALPVTLRNTSEISVRVGGEPGSQFTLSVEGRPATDAALSSTGGTLHLLGSQLILTAPAGAVPGALNVTATPVAAPSPSAVAGTSIDIGPSGTVFSAPVMLSIAFDPAALPAGVQASALRMNWWNTDHWEALPGNSVDLQRHVVSATTTHFTTFALLANEVLFCPGDANAVGDLRTAVTQVPVNGTVYVCDGTWPVAQVLIDKPMTLRSQNPGGATLTDAEAGGTFQGGEPILKVMGVSSGLVRITDLSLVVTDQGIRPDGTYDKVEIDDVHFSGAAGAPSVGVRIDGSAISGARVDVTNSTFSVLGLGVWPIRGTETNVRHSHFDRFSTSGAVTFSHGGTAETQSFGAIEDNEFTNCGPPGCIRVLSAGEVTIARNRLEALDQSVPLGAITLLVSGTYPNTAPTLIEDNVIISRRTGQSEATAAGWMFQSGIYVADPNARTAIVRRNHVTDAYSGITSTGSLSATDNVFSGGVYAIRQTVVREMLFQRNDMTGLLGSFSVPSAGSSVQCNWWGSTAGPTAPPANTQWAYTPWAAEPIAGTSVACTPTPVPPVPPVATITVAPTSSQLLQGGMKQFTASARDASGNTVVMSPTWAVVNGGGSISTTGLFTAGTTIGTFASTVRASSGGVAGTATITVIAQPVSMTVSPSETFLVVGGAKQFLATGMDAAGNTFSVNPTWSVVSGVGSITSTGVFVAGGTAGVSTLRASIGSVVATAVVTVLGAAPTEVRACPIAGAGVTVPTVAEAVALVAAGGTVRVCDGTHTVNNAVITKPMTVTAEGPGTPTLDAAGGYQVLSVQPLQPGLVTISRLKLQGGTAQQLLVADNYAGTTIADNSFQTVARNAYGTSSGTQSFAVRVIGRSVGTLTVDHNIFVGGDVGVLVDSINTGTGTFTRNSFVGTTISGLMLQSGSASASAVVEDNTFENAGFYYYLLASVPSRIARNTFTSHIERPSYSMVSLGMRPSLKFAYTVADNTILGVGRNPLATNEWSKYPITFGAIAVYSAVADVSRNHITNSSWGVLAFQNELFTSSITASDNVVQTTSVPMAVMIPTAPTTPLTTSLTANWNDFTDFGVAIGGPPYGTHNLRCNWWGQATGPVLTDPAAPLSTLLPFATVPVAGQPRAGCTP